jgi:tetratricopeptide (TPR) repeat protein
MKPVVFQNPHHDALTTLTRLAKRRDEASKWLRTAVAHHLYGLAFVALDVAAETGDPIAKILAGEVNKKASDALLRQLMQRCDEVGHPIPVTWREVAFEVTKKCHEAHRRSPASSVSERSAFVRLAVNLGTRAYELGRFREALEVTLEALEIRRSLEGGSPSADLATCLSNLSIRHGKLEQWEEALAAIEEAVDVCRKLVDQHPEENRALLASCLDNQGIVLYSIPPENLREPREILGRVNTFISMRH